MARLTKKEKEKLAMQMSSPRRTDNWVGIRPVIFNDKRKDSKRIRRESKALCRNY